MLAHALVVGPQIFGFWPTCNFFVHKLPVRRRVHSCTRLEEGMDVLLCDVDDFICGQLWGTQEDE